MSFHVSEQGNDAHKTVLFQNSITGTKAEIYAFGALLNLFSIKHKQGDKNVVAGFQSTEDAIQNITPFFRSAKLSPFMCRMKEGQYTFANKKYKVEKYYSQREALHGLIYDAVFTVAETGADDESAFVTLSYDYDKTDAGFPFFYRIRVTYRLRANNEISITTKVTNLSAADIPMADGWHPYFSLGKKVDDLGLFINTSEMAEFDSHLLPTGNAVPFHKFSHTTKIGDTQLDNSFLLNDDTAKPACILHDAHDGIALNIYADENYPYLQVFIPDDRNSIAIENLSSLPDSFNNAIGLIILQPSASVSFRARFVIATGIF